MADEITYAPLASILKWEKQADGSLIFEASKATGPDLDLDEQIIDPTWAAAAMERWFSTGGNLREMHTPLAAGKALTLEHREDGEYISGHVVEPTSVIKVEKEVLQGLSVGIKRPRVVKDASAPGGRIVDGEIVEVSLVDRPCNPSCKLVLAKAVGIDAPVEAVEEWVDVVKEGNGPLNLPDGPGHGLHDKPFAKAWRALALLAAQEAQEMAELGEDETDCLQRLVNAMYSLRAWAIGEAGEGENVTSQIPNGEQILTSGGLYMATEADLTKRAATLRADGATWEQVAETLVKEVAVEDIPRYLTDANDPEFVAALRAALGDADPADEPGSVAGVEPPAGSETAPPAESAQADAAVQAEADEAAAEEKAAKKAVTAEQVKTMIEEAFAARDEASKTAAADVTKSATAHEERLTALEQRLEEVANAAAPGGPSRLRKQPDAVKAATRDRLEVEAARYRNLIESTPDRMLADGYRELLADTERKLAKLAA